ncbi:hypothetical protein [uncultured Eubacterium sp.]|uniref:hypothetical protein n=1 Tax=uncultured Eubacterium sp. TaxID=165185 RepID=UPI0025D5EE70|nr:hypothetical protein [uncultured Eubacterium sp.]
MKAKNTIKNKKVLYVNKEKATNLSNKSSSQWLEPLEKVYDFDIIIRKVKESVKRVNKKDSHMTVFLWRHHPDLNWG